MRREEGHERSASELLLVGGGARSGKTRFALGWAFAQTGARRVYLATAQAGDDEMRARILRHRQERGSDWTTLEEPYAIVEVLEEQPEGTLVVLDCLTLWLSNLLLRGDEDEAILAKVEDLAAVVIRSKLRVAVVTNEVGLGVVPDHPLGRRFRDIAGWAHQSLSQKADRVYVGLLGTMLRLKPGPVTAVEGFP